MAVRENNGLTSRGPIRPSSLLLTGIVLLAAIGLLTWANYTFASGVATGTDFLHRWLPVRLMFFEGVSDPYSAEVSLQTQLFRYGRPALPGEAVCLFAYPYYIIPFIAPFALIGDFTIARALWMTLLEVCQIATVLVSLQLLQKPIPGAAGPALVIFALLSADMISPFIEGNPASIAGLFMALCLWLIMKERDWLAGLCLSLTTIKPQIALLFFLLVWLWAFSRRRSKILLGSAVSLALLMGVSFILLPGWFAGFIRQLAIYPTVAQPNTPGTIFATWLPQLAHILSFGMTVISTGLLLFEWRRAYKKEFSTFLWTICLTCAILPFTGIPSTKSNLVITLPALVLVLAELSARSRNPSRFVLFFPGVLFFAGWLIQYLSRTLTLNGTVIAYIDLLPFALFLIICLYIVRESVVLAGGESRPVTGVG